MRNTPVQHILCLAVAVTCSLRAASAQSISTTSLTPWPQISIPSGTIDSITDQEIVVRPNDPADPVRSYGWHQIQAIDPALNEHAASLELGRRIWRSSLRLDHGDWTSAAELLEPLAQQMSAASGPTAAAYFSAMFRIALARFDRPAASQAWIRLRQIDPEQNPDHPELAPLYAQGTTSIAMPGDDQLAQAHSLAIAWANATPATRAAVSTDVDALFIDEQASEPAARFHTVCLAAYAGSPQTRAAARAELSPIAQQDDTHRGTWARLAIGRSLSIEPSTSQARLGIAALLEVSLRDDQVAPILAGLALAEAAGVASRIGDPHAARVLSAEFQRRFPGHPAQRTLPATPINHPSPSETTP